MQPEENSKNIPENKTVQQPAGDTAASVPMWKKIISRFAKSWQDVS